METLKILRDQRGVSQKEVAEYLEITPQAYSLYELGKRSPDYETLLKLSDYFSVTVDFILKGGTPVYSRTPNFMFLTQ